MKVIDLNADLGEGMAADAEMFALVSSANIACGGHAGCDEIMTQSLLMADSRSVSVGAHPGYPDPINFGRRELPFTPELAAEIQYQTRRLMELAAIEGVRVRYLKLHGALYNQACRDPAIAASMVEIASELQLPLLALPNSELERASNGRVKFYREGFADRRYDDGMALVPRHLPNAFIHDPAEAFEQAVNLIEKWPIDSLCIHGDNPQAVLFAVELRQRFERAGFTIRSFLE